MPDFKPGIYEDLDYPTYAGITVDGQRAWRSHDLTSLIKCPFTWKNAKAYDESPALLEGRVQHTVFLEHHKFADDFSIDPGFDRRTKAGKEGYEDWTVWAWTVAHLASKIFMIPAWSGVRS
jgi:hypothetical protein